MALGVVPTDAAMLRDAEFMLSQYPRWRYRDLRWRETVYPRVLAASVLPFTSTGDTARKLLAAWKDEDAAWERFAAAAMDLRSRLIAAGSVKPEQWRVFEYHAGEDIPELGAIPILLWLLAPLALSASAGILYQTAISPAIRDTMNWGILVRDARARSEAYERQLAALRPGDPLPPLPDAPEMPMPAVLEGAGNVLFWLALGAGLLFLSNFARRSR